jgi:hypothetical protein
MRTRPNNVQFNSFLLRQIQFLFGQPLIAIPMGYEDMSQQCAIWFSSAKADTVSNQPASKCNSNGIWRLVPTMCYLIIFCSGRYSLKSVIFRTRLIGHVVQSVTRSVICMTPDTFRAVPLSQWHIKNSKYCKYLWRSSTHVRNIACHSKKQEYC